MGRLVDSTIYPPYTTRSIGTFDSFLTKAENLKCTL